MCVFVCLWVCVYVTNVCVYVYLFVCLLCAVAVNCQLHNTDAFTYPTNTYPHPQMFSDGDMYAKYEDMRVQLDGPFVAIANQSDTTHATTQATTPATTQVQFAQR